MPNFNLTYIGLKKVIRNLSLKPIIPIKTSILPCFYFNPFPNKPLFLHVCHTFLLKTMWKKEKLLVRSNFSFSHSFFYPFWRTFNHFHQIQNCRLQTPSVWKSLKFVVWERVNQQLQNCCLH